MKFKTLKTLISSALLFSSICGVAQTIDRDPYRAEIGLVTGLGNYWGEANSALFGQMKPVFGGVFRYKLNTRIAFRGELVRAYVSGENIKINNINAGDLCAEFNFFDLEKNTYKRYSKIYSPYIFTGISFLTDVYNKENWPVAGIPFGLGMKLKLNRRLNIGMQWTSRLMLVDNVEGTRIPDVSDKYNNPGRVNGSNIFNNDLVSAFTVNLTLNIWEKVCNCQKTDH